MKSKNHRTGRLRIRVNTARTFILFSVFGLTAFAINGFAHTQTSTPGFLQEFDRIELMRWPLVGKWLKSNDPFRHRLRVFSHWLEHDPIQMFEELRAHRPIALMSSIPIRQADYINSATVLVSKRSDVIEVLTHPTLFSVRHFAEKMQPGDHMLALDETRINTVEKPWMRKMMPQEDLPKIKKILADLIETSLKKAALTVENSHRVKLDLVNDLGRLVPILLSGKYFGFPGPNLGTMYRWSHDTQEDFFHNISNKKGIRNRALLASEEMKEYAKTLIAERRLQLKDPALASGLDDILSRLLKSGEVEDASLTDERIGVNIVATLIAGVETTQTAVIQALSELIKRPKEYALAREAAMNGDDARFSQYVWEALRFKPLNPVMARYAEQDYLLGRGTAHETQIKKGSTVIVAMQSAMFDEDAVPHANEFLIERPDSLYLHFGYGHHRCLGEMLSLIQVPMILKSLVLKNNLKLIEPPKTKNPTAFPENYWVEFDL